MSETAELVARRTVGVRDIPLVWVAPRRLFARVEDVGAYAWPLTVLLTLVTLIGFATVETGLIDRQVDRSVEARIAAIDAVQRDVVERSELREQYEQQRKQGEFERLLARIQVIVANPLGVLVHALLIAALLYGVVALFGRKPEWKALLTICVYAGFIDLLRMLTLLAFQLRFESLNAYTSLTPLVRYLFDPAHADPTAVAAVGGALQSVDPFVIWYWLAIGIGLSATAQLRGWRAWGLCTMCWLAGAGLNAVIALSTASAGMAAG